MTFAAHFPAVCPPTDAEPAAGIVYRIVRSDPPGPDDFLSHHEAGLLPKADACLRCGLSVFRVRTDGVHQRNLYPRLGEFLAEGSLTPADGQTRLTAGRMPTHTTWWVYDGVDRVHPFSNVEKLA